MSHSDRILEFGLAHHGVELDPEIGYRRVPVAGAGDRIPTSVDFGPFTRTVVCDTVLVFREQHVPLGHLQMPSGIVCSVQVEEE